MGTLRSGEVAPHSNRRARGPTTLRVLLIDDSRDAAGIRDIVEDDHGHFECDLATGHGRSSGLVSNGPYDAYLVTTGDGDPPEMAPVRALVSAASGPVLILAETESRDADRLALEAGAADYLVKDGLTADIVHRSLRYAVEMWRERRKAEDGYRRYLSLFDGVPVGLFRIDPDGVFIEVNETAASKLGYDNKADLLGRSVRDLLADTQSRDVPILTGSALSGEIEVITREGESRWVRVSLEEGRDGSGSLTHYEGFALDITERKRAEARVSVREELLDQVPSAVIVTDMERVCVLWNAHAEVMYGWSAKEAVGEKIDDLTVPDEAQHLRMEIQEILTRGETWEGEFPGRRKDGTVFPAQVSVSFIYDTKGRPIGVVAVSLDLTDTRAAEDELRRYQELATAAYDESSVGKAIVSLQDGRLVSANRALCDFLGYQMDALEGRHLAELTHPQDVDVDVPEFQRLIDAEIDSYTTDKRYLRRDGSVIWGRLQASTIGGGTGPEYVLVEVVDITGAKQAEARLAFQASLLEQMRTPVVATDIRGRITHWNRHAAEAYGWTVEEAVGREFVELVIPGMSAEKLSAIRATIRDTGLWEGELTITRKDGSTFPVWASGAVARDGVGRPAGIVGAIVDLTDVQSARADARSQEMLNRSLLEAVSVPIAIFSAEGDLVACNPSWGASGGRTTHPYIPDSLKSDPPAVREVVIGVEDVRAGERERFVLEYPRDTADGERWMRALAVPIEADGVIVSHWDITDERFARVALEETIRAKDEFITSVSHELRTPLSVVVGLSETLRSGDHSDVEMPEFHDLIADQAQDMALIVEDLLVAGRLDNDTLSVRQAIVDVGREIEAVLRPWEEKDDVEVGVRMRPGADEVYADSLRVRQILRNLVTNAIRYGRAPIEIRGVRTRNRVVISVSDHGDGVPEDALERMFQPYARFGGAEGQPSSVGLGLHVARRLARLMGGDLVYKSDADLTTFLLTLPATPRDSLGSSGNGRRFVRD